MNKDKLLHDMTEDLAELRCWRPTPSDDLWEQGYFAGAISYLRHYALLIEEGEYE